MSNSLEQRVRALEARRGLSADGELSPLEADRRAIAAHGEGMAGFYAWAQSSEGRARFRLTVVTVEAEASGETVEAEASGEAPPCSE